MSSLSLSKQTVSIGLVNPKNPVNVASILRAAGCYGVSSVFYTGYRYRIAKNFNADTKAFHKKIPTIGVDDLKEVVPENASVVAIEYESSCYRKRRTLRSFSKIRVYLR